ncbi:MAG: S-methyl-5'-thioadenosine phosphorylase [Burkholderiaceae bacterium]
MNAAAMHAVVGVIGGSGLYQMDALQGAQEHAMTTPFGSPSDMVVTGTVHGVPAAFIARHARGHKLIPSEVPYRANIHALKQLGVRYVLSFSAVGSLKEEFKPLDMVLPDQFIDLTRQRAGTFFGNGAVAHVSMAQPTSAATRAALAQAVAHLNSEKNAAVTLHQGATYVCIEGPQFSSLAESQWYRSMGAGVIGMTNMPEAKLAREAQMAYATLAMVTDYDCWHPREAHVNASMAIANLMQNAAHAQHIAAHAIRILGTKLPDCESHSALAAGLVTPQDAMPEATRTALAPLLR